MEKQKMDYSTLSARVSRIVEEKEPEIFNSHVFQNYGYRLSYAMNEARQEVRREIVEVYIEFYNDNGLEDSIAESLFRNYSTEEERNTPINEEGDVYCKDLDLTVNPGKAYEKAMENERFLNAQHIADDFGLGKEKSNAAGTKYVKQKFRDEVRNINTLRDNYTDLKEYDALNSSIGKEVAKEWFDKLMAYGRGFKHWWIFDAKYFTEAEEVAKEAKLGQEMADQAKKEKPGFFLSKIFTPIRRGFIL
ncbi:hypothetical protein KY343_02425 [Candidatus Woesearchaeota archaeon]|nr:hypothetical protein [Candidatus Woesearchaeota archaeon]